MPLLLSCLLWDWTCPKNDSRRHECFRQKVLWFANVFIPVPKWLIKFPSPFSMRYFKNAKKKIFLSPNLYWILWVDQFVVALVQSISHVWHFVTPRTAPLQVLCPPLAPGICSSLWPLSRWWCLTISSSAAPFSFGLQPFPASGSFPMSQLFLSGGQSIRASAWASASVLPVNIKGW